MKDYVIQPFDILAASKEEWAKYHRYRRKRSSEVFHGDPVDDDSSYEEWAKIGLDDSEVKFFVATVNEPLGEIVASLQMNAVKETSPAYKGNEHLLAVNFLSVLKEFRRKGIGLAFLKLVHEFAVENEKRLIVGHALEEDGSAVGQLLGGTEALEMRVNRLSLDDVDWNMVEMWEREGVQRNPSSSLEFHIKMPDEILGNYCRIYTEVSNQMPLDDLEAGNYVITPELRRKYEDAFENTGETWLTALIREKNGNISSLTDVVYNPLKAPLLNQQLTGVDQKYRGQGKGKWVKAAMLLKVRNEFPDIKTVSTSNATSNAPMLAINERLGFKILREVYFIQVETEKLGKFLEGR
ncbi:MAG: GNAT family N-acetyltransferase [Candidatus Thorarchaeota archaeon]|nr:GNAT family N-acetyltransferase [Candidatus Thorarchaeota archaeon]